MTEKDAPATLAGFRTVGTHEAGCKAFETGWLCTMTCDARVLPPGTPSHETTCAYYGLPFKRGSANRICPCPGNVIPPGKGDA